MRSFFSLRTKISQRPFTGKGVYSVDMILGPVSYLDCLIFCIFLTPQLILNVGLFETIKVTLQCLPFLGTTITPEPSVIRSETKNHSPVFQLPAGFIQERFLLRPEAQPAFVRQASPFEDVVVRCVRYAFANISPKVGRVFFGKNVALPWMRWRSMCPLPPPPPFQAVMEVSWKLSQDVYSEVVSWSPRFLRHLLTVPAVATY